MHSYKLDINNNLKNNLRYLIKKYKIDNETLAKCTGLSLATIASLRTRSNNPTVLTLQPLADFFNLTIDQLINHDCSELEDTNSKIQKILLYLYLILIWLADGLLVKVMSCPNLMMLLRLQGILVNFVTLCV